MIKCFNFPINSLKSICVDYIVNNLAKVTELNKENLGYLPNQIKDQMLSKFTVASYYWRNVTLKEILSLLLHQKTVRIDLTNMMVDDEILDIVEKCTELLEINLVYDGVHSLSSKGLIKLFSNIHKLSIVRIANCDVFNDDVLETLLENNTRLAGLDVRGCCNLTDKSLCKLSKMQNIICLNLSETKVTSTGLEQILKGHSGHKLLELRISNCPNVSENVLKIVTAYCTSLQILIFSNNYLDQFGENLESEKLRNLKQLTWTVSW